MSPTSVHPACGATDRARAVTSITSPVRWAAAHPRLLDARRRQALDARRRQAQPGEAKRFFVSLQSGAE